MKNQSIIQQIAQAVMARQNCTKFGNTEWFEKWTDRLRAIQRNYLPSGSGIDNGTKIDLDRSTGEKIVLTAGFHHMDQHGYYDGWTDYTITVRPSFVFGIDISIRGRNRNDIKTYLHDMYSHALQVTTVDPITE